MSSGIVLGGVQVAARRVEGEAVAEAKRPRKEISAEVWACIVETGQRC